MAGERVEITGLKELVRDLKRLDKALVAEVRKINLAAAKDVATTAKGIAPRRTGRLAGSIRAYGQQTAGIVRAGGGLRYGKVIHFGWPRHHIRPQPFLYAALDSRRDEVRRVYEERIAKLIDSTIKD